jgi:hypothetical protein
MPNTTFIKSLNSQTKSLRSTWNLTEGKAFGMWFAMRYYELDDSEAFESVSVDGGNDKDIDFFYVDHEAERVVIGQFKFNKTGKYKGKKNELLGLLHTIDWLQNPEAMAREGRPELEEAANDYVKYVSTGYSVEFVYAYCGPERRDVVDAARYFNSTEAGNVPSKHCTIVTLETLRTMYEESVNQQTRLETCKITLKRKGYFEETGAFGKAIVTTIPGEELRQLHNKFGDRLFDRNVRLFLGAHKGGVNAGIRDTLISQSDRKNFWAYNNGVTFICDRYVPQKGSISLHNFSIVNGCQTTVSLANADSSATRDARVLARFIAAPERIIDAVIRFTNSQNPIRLWDLNAQDKLQKKIRRELGKLAQPFLYMLRRGETRQLTSDDRAKFKRDGKIQVIPHDVNAQYLAAFRGLPAIAYKDKGKVFSAFRDQVFPAQIRIEEVVLAWQAGNVSRNLVKKELTEAVSKNNDRRISILKRGAAFFVLGVMGLLLNERNGNAYLNKLKAEVASSKTTVRRLENYARIALEWYIESASDIMDTGVEMASLVRSQEGWNKVKPKVESKWKVYRVAKTVMEAALPKL